MVDTSGLATAGFYQEHLESRVLPFWLANGVDEELGGFYTCFDNLGRSLVSTDKYLWSQGRFIWLLARAAALARRGLLRSDADQLLELADRGARFVTKWAVLPDRSCRYVVGRDGGAPETGAGGERSLYADCFVVLGLAELARVSRDRGPLRTALEIYEATRRRLDSGDVLTAPYPVPAGQQAYGVAMTLLSIANQLSITLEALGKDGGEPPPRHATGAGDGEGLPFRSEVEHWLETVTTVFLDGQDVRELVDVGPQGVQPRSEVGEGGVAKEAGSWGVRGSLLERHRTPGHAIEGMAFAIAAAERTAIPGVLERGRAAILHALDLGWDEQYGGLFRYVDQAGGAPSGTLTGGAFEDLVRGTWDTKLWWPQVEALYAARLVYERTGDPVMAGWCERLHEYTFATFPAAPGEGEEWIQIRDRRNRPLEKVVALPVKDPFHITRCLLLLVDLLADGPMER